MTRQESAKYCNDKNNNLYQYVNFIIKGEIGYHADKKRVELHKKVLNDFGYELNDKTYARSKHIFANLPKVIQAYHSALNLGDSLKIKFLGMLMAKIVMFEKDYENIIRFIAGFLTEKRTRDFINGTLKPYNDINIFDLVFVIEALDEHFHSYYKR